MGRGCHGRRLAERIDAAAGSFLQRHLGESARGVKHGEAAAEFLYQANMPLVYGLSNVTCEAQREAVALAEMIGGVVDSHTSL